jgi:hypothetical protein
MSISLPVEINTAASKECRRVKDSADAPSAALVIRQLRLVRRFSTALLRPAQTSKIFLNTMQAPTLHAWGGRAALSRIPRIDAGMRTLRFARRRRELVEQLWDQRIDVVRK